MASIKACDLDGQMFIERAPDSISISQGAWYDEDGKAHSFSGELCPECGRKVRNTTRHFQALSAPKDFHDEEVRPTPDYDRIKELERENGIG